MTYMRLTIITMALSSFTTTIHPYYGLNLKAISNQLAALVAHSKKLLSQASQSLGMKRVIAATALSCATLGVISNRNSIMKNARLGLASALLKLSGYVHSSRLAILGLRLHNSSRYGTWIKEDNINFVAPGTNATLLHIAATHGDVPAARALLAYGLGVNSQAINQLTPLHLAVKGGQAEMVRMLLASGADKGMKDASGLDALGHAQNAFSHKEEIIGYLASKPGISANSKK